MEEIRRDVWRIQWWAKEGPCGDRVGELNHGLWVLPHDGTPEDALRDASLWLAQNFTVPGSEDSYPVARGVALFEMVGDKPMEVARKEIVRSGLGDPFILSDGTEVRGGRDFKGWYQKTTEGWTGPIRY